MIDPNDTLAIDLGHGRVIHVRVGSVASWREYRNQYQKLCDLNDTDEYLAGAVKLVEDRIVRREGFDGDVGAIMSRWDLVELAQSLPSKTYLRELDKKKCELQSPTPAGPSVPAANAGEEPKAEAETNQDALILPPVVSL